MDVIALLGVDEGDYVPPQKSQGHESLLAIAETVIFIRVGDPLEDLFCVNEIESVFLQVQTPFSLTPCNHRESVYTNGICVKEKAPRSLPRDSVVSPTTPPCLGVGLSAHFLDAACHRAARCFRVTQRL